MLGRKDHRFRRDFRLVNGRHGLRLVRQAATPRLARLVTKDRVTSPLRAPFVRYQEGAGEGEVEEESRGEGMQQAVGDLLTCPYCIGIWFATPMWFGMILAPWLARFIAGILLSVTTADFTYRAYLQAKKGGDG